MKTTKPKPAKCDGRLCSIRDRCALNQLPSFGLDADYSQVPEFKPAAPSACRMFKEIKK